MESQTVQFIFQGMLGLIMFGIGVWVRAMNETMLLMTRELKLLNDSVLSNYATRKDVHDLRDAIQPIQSRVAVLESLVGQRRANE